MTDYVKLISETQIEYPPVNKDGISNYNLDIDRLMIDGYKEFVPCEIPETDRYFEIHYKETKKKVTTFVYWLETEEAYTLRIFNLVKNDKLQENSFRANQKLIQGSFYIEVDGVSLHYFYNEDTKNDLNSSALGFIAGAITEKQWTDEDGNTAMLTREHITEMLLTLEAWGNPVWDKWGYYKKLIDNCTTKEEIDAIVIDYSDLTIPEETQEETQNDNEV